MINVKNATLTIGARVLNRAWQINRINRINTTNRINNRLIDLCKLGLGLIWINMD